MTILCTCNSPLLRELQENKQHHTCQISKEIEFWVGPKSKEWKNTLKTLRCSRENIISSPLDALLR